MLYPLVIILKLCHQVILDIVDFLARGVYPQLSFLYVQYRSKVLKGSKSGALVRALASHQCGPGSNPGVDAIYVG